MKLTQPEKDERKRRGKRVMCEEEGNKGKERHDGERGIGEREKEERRRERRAC